jgi:hypothetical protein
MRLVERTRNITFQTVEKFLPLILLLWVKLLTDVTRKTVGVRIRLLTLEGKKQ